MNTTNRGYKSRKQERRYRAQPTEHTESTTGQGIPLPHVQELTPMEAIQEMRAPIPTLTDIVLSDNIGDYAAHIDYQLGELE